MKLILSTPPTKVRIVGDADTGLNQVVAGLISDARLDGAEAGRAEAFATAANSLEEAGDRFDQIGTAARTQIAGDSIRLGLAIARQLLRVEVESDRYDLEAVVRDALEQSGTGRRNCTVHLNPKDIERLKDVTFRSGTQIEADVSVPVGDVHITTPDGLLVRDLDRAVETIGQRIFGELR
ncbi:MAG: flagellar biosynthesis/type III secretory pathway protein FliH [Planctomycetota bacterium]|jgi:flagellar biosynthesis/type III secretory pathway protein FliH